MTFKEKRNLLIGITGIIIIPLLYVFFQIIMNYFMYLLFTWPIHFGDILTEMMEVVKKSMTYRVIFFIILIFISSLLYKIKKNCLNLYGIIEYVGGVFTLWISLFQDYSNPILFAISIGAGMFLIVSGLENVKRNQKN